jgi:hypothetical protein
LFLLYINDLTSATEMLKVVLFADDFNLVIRGKDPTTLSKLMIAELANAEACAIGLWREGDKLRMLRMVV